MFALLLLLQATSVEPAESGAPSLNDATTASQIVSDCSDAKEKCLASWRDINLTLGEAFGAFTMQGTDAVSWSFTCSQDAMTDKKSCMIRPEDAGDGIGIFYQGSPTARLFFIKGQGKAYPGSSVSVRVDGLRVHSVSESALFTLATSNVIIQEMARGRVARTRYHDWPYNRAHDREVDLKGFKDVLAISDELAKQYFRRSGAARKTNPK